jgi:hypothetical protein
MTTLIQACSYTHTHIQHSPDKLSRGEGGNPEVIFINTNFGKRTSFLVGLFFYGKASTRFGIILKSKD